MRCFFNRNKNMKLISFSAQNYRSISTAYKLPLTEYTVIVGPNNEGKSNILKGLGLALALLSNSRYARYRRIPSNSYFRNRKNSHDSSNRIAEYLRYDWDRDFPINLQESKPDGLSEFTCEFELNKTELNEFKSKTEINLTTNLKVRISIGKEREVKFDFLKEGKGKASLNKKRDEISDFINKKLFLQYIPAVRTSELAINIVNNLLEVELSTLEDNIEFKKIVKAIAKLQQPIINKISTSLKDSVSGFIPDVRKISIKNEKNIGELISASCRVYVDDGIETELQLKGDGVISLTAISLLQDFSRQSSLNKDLVLLLEEPESHLHPKAIHSLKRILYEISKKSQVIITTHSPIMIERLHVTHNIVVQGGKAESAKSINQVRDSLGVVMSDNLSNAYLALLVEGKEDTALIKSWLEEKSKKIKLAIESGTLILDHLGGATNVGYKMSYYKNNLCNVVAYLDNDEAGRKGIEAAESKGILKVNEYVLASCKGMNNSEIEDLIVLSVYKEMIINGYGVNLDVSGFKNSKKQWSNRVKDVFILNGKIWSDKLENEVKLKVTSLATNLKLESLNKNKTNSIDSLVLMIENILDKQK